MASNMGRPWWEDPDLPESLKQFAPGAANALGGAMQAAPGIAGQLAATATGVGPLYGVGQGAQAVRSLMPQTQAAPAQTPAPTTYPGQSFGFGQDARSPGYGTPATPGTGTAPTPQYPSTVPPAPAATPYNPTYGGADIDPQSALEQGRASMMRQLRARGINPYGGNPVVNALLERVQDIINANIGGLQGRNDPIQALQEIIQGAVGRALTGKGVFPTAGAGTDPLANLGGASARVNAAQESGQQPNLGDAFIAQLLSNPRNAAALASDTLFGGQGKTFSAVGATQMADLADLYRQIQGEIGPENLQPGAPGFLDWLIQRKGQTGRMPGV